MMQKNRCTRERWRGREQGNAQEQEEKQGSGFPLSFREPKNWRCVFRPSVLTDGRRVRRGDKARGEKEGRRVVRSNCTRPFRPRGSATPTRTTGPPVGARLSRAPHPTTREGPPRRVRLARRNR